MKWTNKNIEDFKDRKKRGIIRRGYRLHWITYDKHIFFIPGSLPFFHDLFSQEVMNIPSRSRVQVKHRRKRLATVKIEKTICEEYSELYYKAEEYSTLLLNDAICDEWIELYSGSLV